MIYEVMQLGDLPSQDMLRFVRIRGAQFKSPEMGLSKMKRLRRGRGAGVGEASREWGGHS